MAKIQKIQSREILDSRGIPAIEAEVILDNGKSAVAISTSGESLGKYEGVELRDKNDNRYGGTGVKTAVSYINDLIGPKLVGVDPTTQVEIDQWLVKADGTDNKSRLGVNTIMLISQLVLKAAAVELGVPCYRYVNSLFTKITGKKITLERIPALIVNVLNGGKHGTRNLEFQEFHIIPSTSLSYSRSLQFAVEAYRSLRQVLEYRNAGIAVSDEGGFVPSLLTNIDALEIIKESLVQKKAHLGVDVYLGIDLAASQFFSGGRYQLKDRQQPLKIDEYIDFLMYINKEYSILVLEDPVEQEDFAGWKMLNEKVGANTYVVGDDFLAGRKSRLLKAIKEKACSAILVKFNQAGTITEMFETIAAATEANFKVIFSHRLGESNDSVIADIAVGTQADFVKFGAPVRGERVAKYNRLLQIEREMSR